MFRKDINGLRAIAVIAVVIFHFQPSWMQGGFAGVDVFFVISGFLMTKIIFSGIEKNNFSILKFYVARANRIIPALALLCLVLLFMGMLILTPLEYKELSKHVAGSIGFFSNITYWSESGYFDSDSHEKWLLHTWSLSVEWQFYLIYPLFLVLLRKFISLNHLKTLILAGTIASFILCVYFTFKWPSGAYFLLPSRIWEMMIGGVAYLYPINFLERNKKLSQLVGLALIVSSYFLISETTPWPGYLAIFPVIGAFLVIQSRDNNSVLTGNLVFQKIGTWSYSIYLWHWPLVVAIYYFDLSAYLTIFGLSLSVLLGYLSYRFIENIRLESLFTFKNVAFQCKPMLMVYMIGGVALFFHQAEGSYALSAEKLLPITKNITPSPYRDKCHITENGTMHPDNACTYFNDNVTWAVIGDSHTVELAYALGKELDTIEEGIKHLSFSNCKPSFGQDDSMDNCTKWTNEAVAHLLNEQQIQNIVVGYRYTAFLFGDQLSSYPNLPNINQEHDLERENIINSLDSMVKKLSSMKKNVFVIKPVPELGKPIRKLIRNSHRQGKEVTNLAGTSRDYFQKRNEFILEYFDNAVFSSNVVIIDPAKFTCDNQTCWAVVDGRPLYFDDDHLSIIGASPIAKEIVNNYKKI